LSLSVCLLGNRVLRTRIAFNPQDETLNNIEFGYGKKTAQIFESVKRFYEAKKISHFSSRL